MCRAKGVQIRLPQPHTCTPKCRMVELPRTNPTVYICAWSRSVHVCGEKCDRHEMSPDNSGYVCTLTGQVLPFNVLTHYVSYDENNPKKRKGDHHVKMASGRASRRRRVSSVVDSEPRRLKLVKGAIRRILMAPERKQIYEKACKRFRRDVCDKFRSEFGSKGYVDYLRGLEIIMDLRKHYGRNLNRPAVEMSDTLLNLLAASISDYFIKVRQHCNDAIHDTSVSVEIFTACVLVKLAQGYTIDGVTLIPRIPFFERHVPADTQFRDLNFRCRNMSACDRHIHSACLTDSDFVRYNLKFRLPDSVIV